MPPPDPDREPARDLVGVRRAGRAGARRTAPLAVADDPRPARRRDAPRRSDLRAARRMERPAPRRGPDRPRRIRMDRRQARRRCANDRPREPGIAQRRRATSYTSPSRTGTRATTPAGPPTWTAGSPSTTPDAARDCSRSSPRPASSGRSPEPGRARASANADSNARAAPRADARSAAPTESGHDDRVPRDRHRRGTA